MCSYTWVWVMYTKILKFMTFNETKKNRKKIVVKTSFVLLLAYRIFMTNKLETTTIIIEEWRN